MLCTMRSYPHNSPEAAARILALVLIADGRVCASEFEVLQQLGAERALGLEPHLLPHIIHTLHEELLLGGCKTEALLDQIHNSALALLMAEISDPSLQRTVMRLSLAAARADGRLAAGETIVLDAARSYWQLVDGEEPSRPDLARRRRACWPELAFRRDDLQQNSGSMSVSARSAGSAWPVSDSPRRRRIDRIGAARATVSGRSRKKR